MSEYAKRLSDNAEIYVGSCEDVYQARWSQREDFVYGKCCGRELEDGTTDYYYEYDAEPRIDLGTRWRLPYPDEDCTEVGDYDGNHPYRKNSYARLTSEFLNGKDGLAESRGLVQFRDDITGMLVNVTCYHGIRLPKDSEGVHFFWNGKGMPIRMSAVKNTEKELRIVVKCLSCGDAWSFSFNEVAPYIVYDEMALRLLKDCQDYWEEKNDTPSNYELSKKVNKKDGTPGLSTVSIFKLSEDSEWTVEVDGEVKVYGEFDLCSAYYKAR